MIMGSGHLQVQEKYTYTVETVEENVHDHITKTKSKTEEVTQNPSG